MRRYAWLVAIGLSACGGGADEAETSVAAPVEPWGLGEAATEGDAGPPACDTVLVIALDKVLAREVMGSQRTEGVTPFLDSVLAGAFAADDAITTSTAGNSAMASLLTGRHGFEHGILSLRDQRRQRLPEAERTLAEGFRGAGWTTVFSSGSPRHARGFSGFSQGFDHYEAPRLSEPTRPAPSVANGALLPLRRALAAKENVFTLLSFDDLTARSLVPPDASIAAPFVRRRLEPIAGERADVEAALQTMESDPGKGLEDLAQRLARARGTRASNAWKNALRDAHLSVIDSAVGEVLGAIEASGRARRTMVIIAGLRGTLPPGYRQEAGPLMVKEAIQIPLAVRFPGGERMGARHGGPVSLRDVSAVAASVGGFELEPSELPCADLLDPGAGGAERGAFAVDSGRKVIVGLNAEVQAERYHTGKLLVFDRGGGVVKKGGPGAPPGFLDFVQRLSSNEIHLDAVGSRDVSVRYEVHPGGARLIGSDAAEAVRGSMDLEHGSDAKRGSGLRLSQRDASVQLRLESADASPLDPSGIQLGDRMGGDVPLLFTPLEGGGGDLSDEEAAGLPPVRLSLERADGLWWTLRVGGEESAGAGGEAEVLLSVWPPREATDEIEVSPDPGMSWEAVPGRLDLVRITGVAPFRCRVKKLGKEAFAVACRGPEGFIKPLAMESFGQRFATPSAFVCVIPDHQKGASERLPSLESALYSGNSPEGEGAGWLRIRRSSIGRSPEDFEPVDVGDLDEVARLIPGE